MEPSGGRNYDDEDRRRCLPRVRPWASRGAGDRALVLDRTPQDEDLPQEIRAAIESESDRIADLHVWRVGPGHHTAIVSVVSSDPQAPSHYKSRLARIHEFSHVTVEVERHPGCIGPDRPGNGIAIAKDREAG